MSAACSTPPRAGIQSDDLNRDESLDEVNAELVGTSASSSLSESPSLLKMKAYSDSLLKIELDWSGQMMLHVNVQKLYTYRKLQILNLSHNKLKELPVLYHDHLRMLLLADNQLDRLPNVSHLPNLEVLNLDENGIDNLDDVCMSMPSKLTTLRLAANRINDLNQMKHLRPLHLSVVAIGGNPCLAKSNEFDHRPFIVSQFFSVTTGVLSLETLDDRPVDDAEQLKGEWLFSQGKISQFTMGEHERLVAYLIKYCPLDTSNASRQSIHLDQTVNKIVTDLRQRARSRQSMTSIELNTSITNFNNNNNTIKNNNNNNNNSVSSSALPRRPLSESRQPVVSGHASPPSVGREQHQHLANFKPLPHVIRTPVVDDGKAKNRAGGALTAIKDVSLNTTTETEDNKENESKLNGQTGVNGQSDCMTSSSAVIDDQRPPFDSQPSKQSVPNLSTHIVPIHQLDCTYQVHLETSSEETSDQAPQTQQQQQKQHPQQQQQQQKQQQLPHQVPIPHNQSSTPQRPVATAVAPKPATRVRSPPTTSAVCSSATGKLPSTTSNTIRTNGSSQMPRSTSTETIVISKSTRPTSTTSTRDHSSTRRAPVVSGTGTSHVPPSISTSSNLTRSTSSETIVLTKSVSKPADIPKIGSNDAKPAMVSATSHQQRSSVAHRVVAHYQAAKVKSANDSVSGDAWSSGTPIVNEYATPKQAVGLRSKRVMTRAVVDPMFARKQAAAVRIQAWWRGVSFRASPYCERLYSQIYRQRQSEHIMRLTDEMQQMKKVNESLTDVLTDVVSRVASLETELRANQRLVNVLLPTVGSVQCQRRQDDSAIVSWTMRRSIDVINGFQIFVNGEPCGRVDNSPMSVQITEIDTDLQHSISIQPVLAVGNDELPGTVSAPLVLPAQMHPDSFTKHSLLNHQNSVVSPPPGTVIQDESSLPITQQQQQQQQHQQRESVVDDVFDTSAGSPIPFTDEVVTTKTAATVGLVEDRQDDLD